MKRILLILLTLSATTVFAQSLDEIYALIEQNNVSLHAYAAQCQASKLEARTGITLADPEVELGYLWGTPGEIGNRKDFSLTQSFDFATLFGARRREARSREELAEIEYQQARNLVLFSAQQLIIELTFTNKSLSELQQRLTTATQLEESYKTLLAKGEVSKIELNRVQLSKTTAAAEVSSKLIEREALIERLRTMCSNAQSEQATEVDYKAVAYPLEYLKGDKSLALSQQEIEVANQQVKTSRSENRPEFSAGYLSELTVGEKFRGIKVGISIPLWKNRNNVARAKANHALAVANRNEQESKLASQRRELTEKAHRLQELVQFLQTSVSQLDATPLMKKALSAGEISIIDFITDRANYYDLQDQLLTAEYQYQTALAELTFINAQ